jgi:ATP-dependent Clp protease protease subunit
MNYQYSLHSDSREPIMLLDNEIGEGGIVGADFAREMMNLSQNADRIQLWINCIGGSIVDSYSIITAMNKLSIPVDTYNLGMAASSAFNIFVNGRNRYMMDYAQVMTHNAIGGGADSENWNNSIGTILSNKSGKTLDEVRAMMDKETFMNASEAVSNGFADFIEITSIKVELGNESDLKSVQAKFKPALVQVMNKLESKTVNNLNFNMKTVANKLGLNEAANEEQVLSAINKLEADKATALAEARNAADLLKEAENKLETATAKIAEVENTARIEAENALREKAENLVKEAQEAGKLVKGESEEVKAVSNKWVANLISDFEGTKSLIDSLPVNKKSPSIDLGVDTKLVPNMANEMSKINNKTKSK